MVEQKELWVQNSGTADVILGDLNIKVNVGRTLNIYKSNPFLTDEQVAKSLASGSLYKRFQTKALRQVKGPVTPKPPGLDQLKTAKGTIVARKTKTSVIIEPTQADEGEEKAFEFADYGINEVVQHEKDKKGSVVVNVKQYDVEKDNPVSPTGKDIIENLKNNVTDPIGPLAKLNSPGNAKFVVVDNRKDQQPQYTPEVPVAVAPPPAPPVKEVVPEPEKVTQAVKTTSGTVVIGTEEDKEPPPRSLKAIKKGSQDTEMIPDDDVDGADKVIENSVPPVVVPKQEGMRVATRTEEGVIVMKVNDDDAAEKPAARKPKSSKKT